MIDIKQFAHLQKRTKDSFFHQKKIIKQVMAGQTVLCSKCHQPLSLYTPETKGEPGIRCQKKCTDLQLDFI
ncbi:MAG: hypothetical protein QF552_13330 [Litorilituus sp.]|jgi:hypothetical protein|nr:hypothetical protein [Litorilituus sp.]